MHDGGASLVSSTNTAAGGAGCAARRARLRRREQRAAQRDCARAALAADPELWRVEASFAAHDACVTSLLVVGDLVVSAADSGVKVWAPDATGAAPFVCAHRWRCGVPVTAIAHASGRVFASFADGAMKCWDLESGGDALLALPGARHGKRKVHALVSCRVLVSGAVREVLVTGAADGKLRVFDVASLGCVREVAAHPSDVLCLAELFLAGGEGFRLASGGADEKIRVWDTERFRCVATLAEHTGVLRSLAAYGELLVSGADDKKIIVWEKRESWKAVAVMEGHGRGINCLCACAGSLVSASFDRSVRTWIPSAWRCSSVHADHNDWVNCVTRYKGKMLTGSDDRSIKVWS